MRPPTLSLIVPAYNEERRLPRLIDELRGRARIDLQTAGLELVETIVVDDGSVDDGAEVLRRGADEVPGIVPLIRGGANEGKGAATAAGVRIAQGELVLLTDVDLAAPLAEAEKLRRAIDNGADIAIGSRVIDRSAVVGIPPHRRLMGRAFNGFVRALSGLPYRDTQCGFKLMRTEVARELMQEQITPGFAFDVELLMRARKRGLSIAEVPVAYNHDPDSTIAAASASFGMLRDLARLARRLRVPRRTA